MGDTLIWYQNANDLLNFIALKREQLKDKEWETFEAEHLKLVQLSNHLKSMIIHI